MGGPFVDERESAIRQRIPSVSWNDVQGLSELRSKRQRLTKSPAGEAASGHSSVPATRIWERSLCHTILARDEERWRVSRLRGQRALPVYAAFTNCSSSVMVTSSPTRMPPVSRVVFQVRP